MKGTCPVCAAAVELKENTEESEIIPCSECQSRIVVTSVKKDSVVLDKAPEVEEDWGE